MPARSFLTVVLTLLLLSAGLRGGFPGRMAVEHFDEGVYASNLWFENQSRYEYPGRHLYAPPLVPALIEWGLLFLGVSNLVPMLVSLAAGISLPLLVAGATWKWCGSRAALAAGFLAAVSEPHALFSRTALTDSLLVWWLLIAVYCFWEAGRGGGALSAGLAGLATGLAWWTKYNGWLPLAIAGAGYFAWGLSPGVRPAQRWHALRSWLIALGVTFLVWGPYLYSLQARGGYAAVTANHQQYVDGFAHWGENLVRQTENLQYLEGWLGTLSPLLAVLLLLAPLARSGRAPEFRIATEPTTVGSTIHVERLLVAVPWWSLMVVGGVTLGFGSSPALALLSLVGLGLALWGDLSTRSQTTKSRSGNSPSPFAGEGWGEGVANSRTAKCSPDVPASPAQPDLLALWLLAAWGASLLLVTPLYRPYPRLTLAWLVPAWTGAGLGIEMLFTRGGLAPWRDQWRRLRPTARWVIPVALLMLASSASSRLTARHVPPWQDRTDLARATAALGESARQAALQAGAAPDELVLYTYGEPAVLFQLRLAGLPLVAPVSDLKFATPGQSQITYPTFLVTGPHAERDERFRTQFTDLSSRFQHLAEFTYRPSDVILLDDASPQNLTRDPRLGEQQLQLWRLRSSAEF